MPRAAAQCSAPAPGPFCWRGKFAIPRKTSLGLADITVIRNGYGRQLASEIRSGVTALSPAPIEMVFIRAPIIERVGPDVETLATSEGQPVLVRQGHILIATFHPELTSDTTVHEYFLRDGDANRAEQPKPHLEKRSAIHPAVPVEPR